jgi:hypothetical protein
MAELSQETRIEYSESLDFLLRLDHLVVQGARIIVVVPARPSDDSPFFQRIRLCQSPLSPGGAIPTSNENSVRLLVTRFTRYFARLRREPDYHNYVASVRKDCNPLEVHLSPK